VLGRAPLFRFFECNRDGRTIFSLDVVGKVRDLPFIFNDRLYPRVLRMRKLGSPLVLFRPIATYSRAS
jgi:hypothetical protein